ncbi:MAG: DUF1634 domain-containing protein [Candidatus Methanomethylophilaceae archaeon]|nr:DUF1634 domain-containing protein [Candidatus Methanomethylophilaceae archaeon]
MNLNKTTARTLRVGIIIGMALIAIGLILSALGYGNSMLSAGILILIISPLAGVIASFAALATEKDWFWASIAAILLAITVVGMVLAALRWFRPPRSAQEWETSGRALPPSS